MLSTNLNVLQHKSILIGLLNLRKIFEMLLNFHPHVASQQFFH
jgi:hypothetical protein